MRSWKNYLSSCNLVKINEYSNNSWGPGKTPIVAHLAAGLGKLSGGCRVKDLEQKKQLHESEESASFLTTMLLCKKLHLKFVSWQNHLCLTDVWGFEASTSLSQSPQADGSAPVQIPWEWHRSFPPSRQGELFSGMRFLHTKYCIIDRRNSYKIALHLIKAKLAFEFRPHGCTWGNPFEFPS